MTFETLVTLVALSLPVWLVAEQVYVWRRSLRNAGKRVLSEPVANAVGPSWVSSGARNSLAEAERKAA